MISEADLTDLVDRLLEVGVPPTAVAKAFGIDPFVVRDRQNELRVAQYGAAELSEALAVLQWQALDQAKAMIYDAPYTVRSRFIMAILSKTMSLTARQSPETMGNLRVDLLKLMDAMVAGDSHDELADVDPSEFVAALATDEDKDQGSDD